VSDGSHGVTGPGEGAPPPRGRPSTRLALIALAAIALVVGLLRWHGDGIAMPTLAPLFSAFTGGDDEPIWGTAGPLHGDPLEAGTCDEAAALDEDPDSPLDPDAHASLPEGLALWLRSDHGVERDASGRVSTWHDLSPARRDFVAAAGRPAPLWVARAWQCRAALRFEGAESLVRSDVLGLDAGQPRTYVVVARLRDPVERSQLFSQGESGSLFRHVGLEVNTWQTAGQRFGVYAIGHSFDASTATHRRIAVHVLVLGPLEPGRALLGDDDQAPALVYWIDGVEQALALRSGPGVLETGLDGATRTTVGDFSGPGEYAYRGDVFEVQIYARALEGTERQRVEQRLGERWGVPITGGR